MQFFFNLVDDDIYVVCSRPFTKVIAPWAIYNTSPKNTWQKSFELLANKQNDKANID